MTEEQIRTEVALLKQDTGYIKSDISEIKACLKDINECLKKLTKNSHDPESCKTKHEQEIEKLKKEAVMKADISTAKNFIAFVIVFSALVGAVILGNAK